MKSLLPLFLLAFALVCPAAAQSSHADLERVVPALMDSAKVTGLALALVEDGEVAWAKGFGVRSAVTNPPVDAHTVFEAASLSKPIFAYIVLQLVDEGVLALDVPLATYLPYEAAAHDARYQQITAQMVLSHTSGFPNWRPRTEGSTLDVQFVPGTRFQYSGEGYVYLQRVAEHLTGMILQELAQARVFDPLGMTETSYVWADRFGPAIAVGHATDGTAFDKFTPEEGNAAFSLHTTAPDFARFLAAVMAGEGLSAASHKAMIAPQSDAEGGMYWGLGWGVQLAEGVYAFWHWGDNTGFKSFALAFPATRHGLVYFTNSDNGMVLLHTLLTEALGADQPAADWLGYDRYDAPQRRLADDLFDTLLADGVDAAVARYDTLRASAVYPPTAFDEDLLNDLGYRLLRTGRGEAALAFFEKNVALYPDAWNPHDSLGEIYLALGNREEALTHYARSVELNPGNAHGAEIVRRLRAALGQ